MRGALARMRMQNKGLGDLPCRRKASRVRRDVLCMASLRGRETSQASCGLDLGRSCLQGWRLCSWASIVQLGPAEVGFDLAIEQLLLGLAGQLLLGLDLQLSGPKNEPPKQTKMGLNGP